MTRRSWIRALLSRKPSPVRRRTHRPTLESLEDRVTPTTYTLTNVLDDGSTGSLRWAIEQANNNPGPNTIVFPADLVTGNFFGLIVNFPAVIQLNQPLPAISNDLTINGDPIGDTVSGIASGTMLRTDSGINVQIDRLTFANGGSTRNPGAGAIDNMGNLTITNCTFNNNAAGRGGAITNEGQLDISGCTFVGDEAPSSPTTAPTATATSSTNGGKFSGPGDFLYEYTWVNRNVESAPSPASGPVTVAANDQVTVQIPALPMDATQANIYRAPFTGGPFVLVGSTTSQTFIDQDRPTGASPPAATAPGTILAAASNGGAIWNNGTLTVSSTSFTSFLVGSGGAIDSVSGNVMLDHVTLSGNTAQGTNGSAGQGGALLIAGGSVSVSNSTLSDNTAQGGNGGAGASGGVGQGGALLITGGSVSLSASTVSDNTAQGGNGGAGASGGAGQGGALAITGGSVSFSPSTISDNTAQGGNGGAGASGGVGQGGAFFITGGSVTVSDSTISGNSARGGVGGTATNGPNGGNGVNATFFGQNGGPGGNGSGGGAGGAGGAGQGGGLWISGGTLDLILSTLADNIASGGVGLTGGNGGSGGSGGNGANGSTNPLGTFPAFGGNGGNGANGGNGGDGGAGGAAAGGGVLMQGGSTILDVIESTVANNQAVGGGGGMGGNGGRAGNGGNGGAAALNGVSSGGTGGNGGNGGNGGASGAAGGASGGGIEHDGGTLTVTNATVAYNLAVGGAGILSISQPGMWGSGGSGGTDGNNNPEASGTHGNLGNFGALTPGNPVLGGGINAGNGNSSASLVTLDDSLIASNKVGSKGSGIDGTVDKIGSKGSDIDGTVDAVDSAYNLISTDDAGGLVDGNNGNQVTNPVIGPLADNGGPTETVALLPGSPAIDAGNGSLIPIDPTTGMPYASDQRGLARIRGASVDLGAYEAQGFLLTATSGNHQGTPTSTAFGNSLVVTVTALDGVDPVAGGRLSFATPFSGASATLSSPNPVTIASDDTATVSATANGTPGAYQVTADTAGVATPVAFALANQAALSNLSVTPYNVPYDGTFHMATGTATGADGADVSADLTLSATTHTKAGTYTDTWTFHDPTGVYPDKSGTVSDSISAVSAHPSVTGFNVPYDGTPHSDTGSATDVHGNALPASDFVLGTHTHASTYIDAWSFHDPSGNYLDASGKVVDGISPGTPTIQVSDAGGTYNGTPFAATATVAGIVAGLDNMPAPTLEGVAPTLTYYVGTFTLATLPTSGGSNTAPAAASSYTVLAFIPGSSNYDTASAVGTFTVSPAATKTSTASLSSTTAVYGQPVTLTVTVSNTQTAVAPSGNVVFYNGSTQLGTAPVGAGGTASLSVSTMIVGKHAITALFSDPANDFAPSGSPTAVSVTISKDTTTTALTATNTTSVFGQAVTFTATVTADAPSMATPTGTVTFKDGSTVLQTVSLSGGTASFTTRKLAVGSHSVTVTYSGTGNLSASSSASSSVTVGVDATMATVTSSSSSPVYGQTVTLKATVTAVAPGSGTPTGSVNFYAGTTLLGTASLTSGVASIKTTALSLGANPVTVVYGGDGNFVGTTSAALPITVNQDTTKTNLTESSATAAAGTPVTFTATVLPVSPGSGAPTGTVSFWDGSTLLSTVNLSGGVAQLTLSFSVTGKHKIKAVYNGDVDFLSSISAVLTETIS